MKFGAAALIAGAAIAACATSGRVVIARLFGPPSVQHTEAYAGTAGGEGFDHSQFDALLREHVAEGGYVNYKALSADPSALDGYIASLAGVDFDLLSRDEKLAVLLNAYNAFTLRLILDYYPIKSIRDIPAAKRWDHKRWRIGSDTWSLNQIEHEQIRPKFAEPRIHFALVCAAVGCPPLRAEAYRADRLDAQLDEQTRYVHAHDLWLRFEPDANTVRLTRLYDWYGGDFVQSAGSVLKFVSRYHSGVRQVLAGGAKLKTRWLEYDWALNEWRDEQ